VKWVELLSTVEMSNHLNKAHRDQIAQNLGTIIFQDGDKVIVEGEMEKKLFIIDDDKKNETFVFI
jgi:hypothetical protein